MTSLNQRITSLENNSGTGTGTLSVAFRVEISNASILKNTNILNQNNVIVSFNIGSGYHTTGVCMGTFVAPEAGYYSFYGKVRLPDDNTTAIEIQFYKKTGTDTDPVFTAYESFEYWINDSAKRRNGGASCFAYLDIGEGMTMRNDNTGAISSGCSVVFHGFKVGSSGSDGTSASLISDVSGLQDELDAKQDVIIDNSLTISNTQNLQSSLDAKQDAILDDNLTISKTLNLQSSLDSKQDQLTAGDNITIVDNVISSSGSSSSPIVMRVSFFNSIVSLSGSNITLPYNTIQFINGISYDTSSYVATINTEGIYYISFSAYNYINRNTVVDIRVNGTSLHAGRFGEKFTTTVIVHGATIVSLNENDEVTIVLDNGTVRMLAVYSTQPELQSCNFCIFKIN